jgi:tricarballylate dehydrogenase
MRDIHWQDVYPAGQGFYCKLLKMIQKDKTYDVLVIGGGNAGLCAAITAREAGASVLVLEAAPVHFRGGNSRHVRNLRCVHDAPEDVLQGSYPFSEYWDDLLQVTGGKTNELLARMMLQESAHCRGWMRKHGARFQPALGGTLQLSRTNAFFLGGGKSLLNAYYRSAEALGVDVEYDAEVTGLDIVDGQFRSASVLRNNSTEQVRARVLVTSAGGFQANIDWLREAWGEAADNFIIRGTPYDNGRILRILMDSGIKTTGEPAQCHAVAVHADSPRFDGGIATRVDCVSLGIVVNRDAVRFYDEGEDFWPKRYAIWGRLIAQQPAQIAYAIIDAKSAGSYLPPVFPPIRADSIPELAQRLSLDSVQLEQTLNDYNAAVRPGDFDISKKDSCHTAGLTPTKSHWARKLDTPPYLAYPLRPGITFTYLGVAVNEKAQVLLQDERPSANIYAAGEIMAGNILGKGYLAGIGMTIGTVFGRIAGREAARAVTH